VGFFVSGRSLVTVETMVRKQCRVDFRQGPNAGH